MKKDFDKWNIAKKKTHNQETEVIFYQREVWWWITGTNIGIEIDGKHEFYLRPAIIVRKFNKYQALIIAPSTTQEKNNKYYLKVGGEDGKHYNACLSQIRAISSKRLFRKIGTIRETDYEFLLNKLGDMIKGQL